MKHVLNPMSAADYFISRRGMLFRQIFFSFFITFKNSNLYPGPWTSAGIEALGTFHTSKQNVENDSPALQLMVIPVGISQDNGVVLRKSMGITDEVKERKEENRRLIISLDDK